MHTSVKKQTNPNRKQQAYFVLTIVGTAIPLYLLSNYYLTEGFSVQKILAQATVNGSSTIFTWDVLVSSLVFWVWVLCERKLFADKKQWTLLFLMLNLFIGVSCALPAYLWWRERQLSGPNTV